MNLFWSSGAWDDYVEFQDRDPAMARKINDLIADVRRSPFQGLGKPEPLRGPLAGWWSRRINQEHRLVYRVVGTRGRNQRVEILQCRFHYDRR
ncbi:MAG TPA: Txe/YoeB family addiction module toxin [Rhizomicrobium sp.]|jgi:toxin YoeB|nr:Txe/YoeB family addiction module toxin [Rhizomicrobium sp.]